MKTGRPAGGSVNMRTARTGRNRPKSEMRLLVRSTGR
jgi:hypothetical protein